MRIDKFIVAGVIAIILLASGCATGPVQPSGAETTPEGQPAGSGAEQSSTAPLGQQADLALDPFNDPNNPLSVRTLYFDYDSSEVAPESLDIIEAHGKYLANNPSFKVRLEGHTDERGSREYNLGLGERRARSVEQLLKLQGVGANQMEIISYGEEMPSAFGHDESSWQLNRRVELVYPEQ